MWWKQWPNFACQKGHSNKQERSYDLLQITEGKLFLLHRCSKNMQVKALYKRSASYKPVQKAKTYVNKKH